jgi:hypothetical protein
MSTQLDQIAKKAKSNPKLRFTSLAHLLTPEFLTETWKQMNRRGASGVDGETTKEFELDLDTRVRELSERLKRGAYRAPPVRRVEIPKGPGKAGTRPLGIPTVDLSTATLLGHRQVTRFHSLARFQRIEKGHPTSGETLAARIQRLPHALERRRPRHPHSEIAKYA